MNLYEIKALTAHNRINDLANKTAVTLSHTFADNTARDTYFTANPTELVDNLFIKVGAGYQQYAGSAWEEATAVVADLSGIESELSNIATEKVDASKELNENHVLRQIDDNVKDIFDNETEIFTKNVSNEIVVDGSMVNTSYIAGSYRRVELNVLPNVKPNGVAKGNNSDMEFVSGTFTQVTTNFGYCYVSATGLINFSLPVPSTGTTADCKAYLNAKPIKLLYELNEPETVEFPNPMTQNTREIISIKKQLEKIVLDKNIIIGDDVLNNIEVWEPTFTTNDYSVPSTGGSLDIKYNEFLANFYDLFLGKYQDGYVVNKKSLGNDASNQGYELFEYDFIPKYYTHTILLSAGMNANELSTIFGVAYFIKSMMEKLEEGMSYLYENVRIKVIPILCPSSFDQSPILYTNYNGVNLNKNFNHLDSWHEMAEGTGYSYKGTAPDSENETKILKKWLSENGNEAELWIDCHSMKGTGNPNVLHYVMTASNDIVTKLKTAQNLITDYYISKGIFNRDDVPSDGVSLIGLLNYPKHQYAKDIYNLPSIMIEQKIDGIWYGGDPTLDNDDGDIRNYVLMLRMYILSLLQMQTFELGIDDIFKFVYQLYKKNHGRL